MNLLDTLPVYNTTGSDMILGRSFIYFIIILLYLSHFIHAASTIINDTSSDDEHISYTQPGRHQQLPSISH
jgi:hypothetical protein